MFQKLLIWHLFKEKLIGKITFWQPFSCLNTLFEALTRCYVTSHWQRWVRHVSIPENIGISPPSCTLRIFHIRIFQTPHFLHSSFYTLLIFGILHFLHSALRVFQRILFSLQFSPFKSLFRSQIDPRKQRKALFQDLLEVILEFSPNTSKIRCVHWPHVLLL